MNAASTSIIPADAFWPYLLQSASATSLMLLYIISILAEDKWIIGLKEDNKLTFKVFEEFTR
jgi:hypothetical protein